MTPEGRVKLAVSNYLGNRGDCFFWWQESIGQYDPKIGRFRKKKSRFQINGVPDVIVLFRVGSYPPVFVGLECKAGSNKQSDSQLRFEQLCKSFGGFYAVVRSPEDAHNYLELIKKHIIALTSQKS